MVQRLLEFFRNVLVQRAAANDVQFLHADADRQRGDPHLIGQLAEAAIEIFASQGHRAGGRVPLETEPHGIQIERAAAKDQAIEHLEELLEVAIFGQGGQERASRRPR